MGQATIDAKSIIYSDDAILTKNLINNFIFKNTIGKLTGYQTQFFKKDLLLDCIQCSPNNFGDVYNFTNDFANKIGIKPPQVFIDESSVINACTFGNAEKAFIVINSKLLDTFTDDEVKFVIGHELGHIVAGHCQISTLAHLLFTSSSYYSSVFGLPMKALNVMRHALKFIAISIRQWEKAAEITADRFGFLAVNDQRIAFNALVNLKMGMINRKDINVDDYLKQFEEIGSNWVYKINEIHDQFFATHPNIFRRILVLKLFTESVKSSELSNNELDAKIHAVLLGTNHNLLSVNEKLEEFLCKAVLFIAQFDGKIDKNEKKEFSKMISNLNISKKLKTKLDEMLECTISLIDISLPFELSDYQLEFLSNAVTDVAASDGSYSFSEDQKLTDFFDHFKLSRKFLDEKRALLIKKYGDIDFIKSMLN